MLQAGYSRKMICVAIGKDKSVISRELKRNMSKRGYSPAQAQMYADERKERFRRPRKFTETVRRKVVGELVNNQWSPEQIVGRARRDDVPMVSHERIYQFIRQDKCKGGMLWKHCRHKLKHRKRPVGGKKIVIPDKIMIDSRPDVINDRRRFGDWEIDLIVGKENKGAILTAVERQTGFLMTKKLKRGKNAKSLAKELFYMFLPYKRHVKSITSDNGSEFYEHKEMAKMLNCAYFFAHPYSSWERGQNEHTNKLIRQYIPKHQSFANYDEAYLQNLTRKLNVRPRKKYSFVSPLELFQRQVAFTT
jgi:IS30 family transposase